MVKLVSLQETLLLIIIIYIFSLGLSIIYLLYYVDRKKISLVILIICILYSSLFIFLNIIVIFDLTLNNNEEFEILLNIIPKFYLIFSLTTKILGLGILSFWINYLESGYFTKWQRFFDIFYRIYNKIKKIKKLKIILVSIAIVVIIIILLILFIIYKDKIGLTSPINYICIFLDIYAVIEIYMNVGFFIIHQLLIIKEKKIYN